MTNYYRILGLSPNGKNEQGNPFSADEIKAAYRKLALKYHPDKNPATRARFEEVQTAYEILENPAERKKFDEEIAKKLNAATDDESLIVILEEEVNGEPNQNFVVPEQNCRDIILAQARGTDISLLIENAEYSGEQILEIAKKKMSFAMAIVDNARSLSYLSIAQQYELLFIIIAHLPEAEIKLFLARNNVKFILTQLTASKENYENNFINACIKHKAVLTQIFKYLSEYISKFSKEFLYSLGHHFPEIIAVVIHQHAASLRIFEVVALLEKHNSHRQAIIDSYMQTAGDVQRNKLKIYLNMTQLLEVCNDWQRMSKIIDQHKEGMAQLGVDAFLLINYCEKKFSQDKDVSISKKDKPDKIDKISITLEDDYKKMISIYYLLTILFESKLSQNFMNFDHQEIDELCYKIISILPLLIMGKDHSIQDGDGIMAFLIKHFPSRYFEQFIGIIELNVFSEDIIEKLTQFILNFSHNHGGDNDSNMPEFWYMLKTPRSAAWKCLFNNKRLLVALLGHQLLNSLSEPLKIKIVYLCSYFELAEDEIPFDKLGETCRNLYKSYNELYTYIPRKNTNLRGFNKIFGEKIPALCKDKIDYSTFKRLYDITGYFEDLLRINMNDDYRICFVLLQGAINDLQQNNEAGKKARIPYTLKFWVDQILDKADAKTVTDTIILLGDDYSDIVFKQVRNISPVKYDFVNKLLIYGKLYTFQLWFEGNITGAMLYDLLQAVYSEKGVNEILSKLCLIFDYEDYSQKLKKAEFEKELNAYPEQHKQIFAKFIVHFKQQQLQKIPQEKFANFIALVESELVKKKAAAYAALLQKIDQIKIVSEPNAYNNETLQELLVLLEQVGVDKTTFNLLQIGLNKHPLLWSAILLLLRESKSYVIHKKVVHKLNDKNDIQEIDEHGNAAQQNKPLELMFLAVAKHYLSKYRNTVNGDKLVAMLNIFGDEIVPDIKLYGLEDKIIQARKLGKIFSAIQQKAASFENQKFNADQTAEKLFTHFELLVNNSLLHELNAQPNAEEYYNELCSFISRIDKERLNLIHQGYPKDNKHNLALWVLNCAFSYEEFSRNKLIEWLTNQNSFIAIAKPVMQYINNSIENNKSTLNAVRDLLGENAFAKLITWTLTQENDTLKTFTQTILAEIDKNDLSIDEIKQRYGESNCDKLLFLFFQIIGISQKRRLLISMIHATLNDDQLCRDYLIKWCHEIDKSKEIIQTIAEIVSTRLQRDQINLDDIPRLFGELIFHQMVTYVFAQNDLYSHPLVKRILDNIEQRGLCFDEIDQLYDNINRDTILNAYLQKYPIKDNNKLMYSFVVHVFKKEHYSSEKLKSWLDDPSIESNVTLAISNYLSEESCIIDIVKTRDTLANSVVVKVVESLLKQPESYGNRIIKQILSEIDKEDLTIDEISRRYGINNTNQLLECYFKSYSIIHKNFLLMSFIKKAFSDDKFFVNKLVEWCASDEIFSIINANVTTVLINKLSEGSDIAKLLIPLGKDCRYKIISFILAQNSDATTILMTQIISRAVTSNFSLDEFEVQFGKMNRDVILHHYLKSKHSFFTWPLSSEEANSNKICKFVLQGALPLNELLRQDKLQLDRLCNEAITRYLESEPQNANIFVMNILDVRQHKWLLMPLIHEGLIDDEFEEIECDTLEYSVYQYLIENADWRNKERTRSQLQQLKQLLSKNVYKQINEYILKPIDTEVERLQLDKGMLLRQSGEQKAMQMIAAKKELQQIIYQDIIDNVKNYIMNNNTIPEDHVKAIAAKVKNKVYEISRRDVIANSRNKVAAFFKRVLGVLLSFPLFCAPLLVEKYRDFFFATNTVRALKNFNETNNNNGSKHNFITPHRIR